MERPVEEKPVVLFTGNFGSGKTEVAVNFALNRLGLGCPVQIADLDVVNPYFRTREVCEILSGFGIDVVVPEHSLLMADLPVVVPQIRGIIDRPKGISILDVGGDDVGATVLGSLRDSILRADHDMLLVVNQMRPFTDSVKGCLKIAREIEAAARLKLTGVVGNSHLMDETTPSIIEEGARFAHEVAEELKVPVRFVTSEERLIPDLDIGRLGCPLLPLTRQMLPPWRRRQKVGPKTFLLH